MAPTPKQKKVKKGGQKASSSAKPKSKNTATKEPVNLDAILAKRFGSNHAASSRVSLGKAATSSASSSRKASSGDARSEVLRTFKKVQRDLTPSDDDDSEFHGVGSESGESEQPKAKAKGKEPKVDEVKFGKVTLIPVESGKFEGRGIQFDIKDFTTEFINAGMVALGKFSIPVTASYDELDAQFRKLLPGPMAALGTHGNWALLSMNRRTFKAINGDEPDARVLDHVITVPGLANRNKHVYLAPKVAIKPKILKKWKLLGVVTKILAAAPDSESDSSSDDEVVEKLPPKRKRQVSATPTETSDAEESASSDSESSPQRKKGKAAAASESVSDGNSSPLWLSPAEYPFIAEPNSPPTPHFNLYGGSDEELEAQAFEFASSASPDPAPPTGGANAPIILSDSDDAQAAPFDFGFYGHSPSPAPVAGPSGLQRNLRPMPYQVSPERLGVWNSNYKI